MVTWHERDLTQSSAERFILPESIILLDYILSLMCNIVANLRVDSERMLQNLSLTAGTRNVGIRHDGTCQERREPTGSPRTAPATHHQKRSSKRNPSNKSSKKTNLSAANSRRKKSTRRSTPKTIWAQQLSKRNGSRKALRNQTSLSAGLPLALCGLIGFPTSLF